MVVSVVSRGSTIRGGYYHNLFVFVGFPYASSLFPHFVVVASSISLLSARVLSPQDPSAPRMVFPQLRTYVLDLSPDFGVSLFVVLIVFLPRVIFLLFSSLSFIVSFISPHV